MKTKSLFLSAILSMGMTLMALPAGNQTYHYHRGEKIPFRNRTVSGCSVEVRDVTVKKGAKLIIQAERNATIGPGFTMETGAELQVK